MKTAYGFDQCYNGQIAVDETTQLIVATRLTNCAADNAELLPLITRAQGPLGGVPPEVLACVAEAREPGGRSLIGAAMPGANPTRNRLSVSGHPWPSSLPAAWGAVHRSKEHLAGQSASHTGSAWDSAQT